MASQSTGAGKGRRGGLTSLGDALGGFLRESGLGAKLRDWDIYDAWGKALGPDLARRARPVGFNRGELVIEVESAAHMHELRNFSGEALRKKTNELLGSQRVLAVLFKLKQ
ncbi:MAG: DUF721 domain-containing protein [Planctomycetota bacterium]|jgi:hypothetical protein|nr:hypothetical protein [Planctomycetota bacterium]MDP6369580.1 DUF721 domain-containing protein [Planctomycetota bacterium]MDP6837922.1 DUF721 domain-containing protein [Planctomycetota bacterium]MDP6955337.1 DUF721 domain-containing protein [Planctomycetota bacterium]